jgi:hypothetical protein
MSILKSAWTIRGRPPEISRTERLRNFQHGKQSENVFHEYGLPPNRRLVRQACPEQFGSGCPVTRTGAPDSTAVSTLPPRSRCRRSRRCATVPAVRTRRSFSPLRPTRWTAATGSTYGAPPPTAAASREGRRARAARPMPSDRSLVAGAAPDTRHQCLARRQHPLRTGPAAGRTEPRTGPPAPSPAPARLPSPLDVDVHPGSTVFSPTTRGLGRGSEASYSRINARVAEIPPAAPSRRACAPAAAGAVGGVA